MFKAIKCMVISLLLLSTAVFAVTPSVTNQFPLQMLNNTNKDIFISLIQDVGIVFFDVELEDNTLLPVGKYSYTYGVNFSPRDLNSQFKIIFKNDKECVFTVKYFKQPEEPKVSWRGDNCTGAGYRTESHVGHSSLVLFLI